MVPYVVTSSEIVNSADDVEYRVNVDQPGVVSVRVGLDPYQTVSTSVYGAVFVETHSSWIDRQTLGDWPNRTPR